jgi:prophage regulatory protein
MSEQILRFKALTEIVGLKRTAIYAKIKEGEFPAPVELGKRARGWRLSEVDSWISKRKVVPVGLQSRGAA